MHLLNLLKVILFECNFHSKNPKHKNQATRDNANNLFKNIERKELIGSEEKTIRANIFIDCLVDGMMN